MTTVPLTVILTYSDFNVNLTLCFFLSSTNLCVDKMFVVPTNVHNYSATLFNKKVFFLSLNKTEEFSSETFQKWHLFKKQKWLAHKSSSVWAWCQLVPVPAALTVPCAGLMGRRLQLRTWPRLFRVPPLWKELCCPFWMDSVFLCVLDQNRGQS